MHFELLLTIYFTLVRTSRTSSRISPVVAVQVKGFAFSFQESMSSRI